MSLATTPVRSRTPVIGYHGRQIVSLPESVVITPRPQRHKRYCARCGHRCYTDHDHDMSVEVYCSAACYQDGPTYGDPFDVVAVREGNFETFHVGSYERLANLLIDVSAPGAGATVEARGKDMEMCNIGFHGLNEQPL